MFPVWPSSEYLAKRRSHNAAKHTYRWFMLFESGTTRVQCTPISNSIYELLTRAIYLILRLLILIPEEKGFDSCRKASCIFLTRPVLHFWNQNVSFSTFYLTDWRITLWYLRLRSEFKLFFYNSFTLFSTSILKCQEGTLGFDSSWKTWCMCHIRSSFFGTRTFPFTSFISSIEESLSDTSIWDLSSSSIF